MLLFLLGVVTGFILTFVFAIILMILNPKEVDYETSYPGKR